MRWLTNLEMQENFSVPDFANNRIPERICKALYADRVEEFYTKTTCRRFASRIWNARASDNFNLLGYPNLNISLKGLLDIFPEYTKLLLLHATLSGMKAIKYDFLGNYRGFSHLETTRREALKKFEAAANERLSEIFYPYQQSLHIFRISELRGQPFRRIDVAKFKSIELYGAKPETFQEYLAICEEYRQSTPNKGNEPIVNYIKITEGVDEILAYTYRLELEAQMKGKAELEKLKDPAIRRECSLLLASIQKRGPTLDLHQLRKYLDKIKSA